ncbi:MAG: hypothetical protein ACPG5P_07495 [Saprospiraceae bacterium]
MPKNYLELNTSSQTKIEAEIRKTIINQFDDYPRIIFDIERV